MSLVEKNRWGYWGCLLPRTCILLSTLNILQVREELNDEKAQRIAAAFIDIGCDDHSGIFRRFYNVPKTIERITNGEFRGILACPNAVDKLKRQNIEDAEKYASEVESTSSILPPYIIVYKDSPSTYHAVVGLGFDDLGVYKMIDNGIPVRRSLRKINFCYEVEHTKQDLSTELPRDSLCSVGSGI